MFQAGALDRAARELAAEFPELLGILEPWGRTIREEHGYPASGPHDLARASS